MRRREASRPGGAPDSGDAASVRRALGRGAVAGSLLSIGDVAVTPFHYLSLRDALGFGCASFALLVGAGAALGAWLAFADRAARRGGIARGGGGLGAGARSMALALAVAPWWIAVGIELSDAVFLRARLAWAAPWVCVLCCLALAISGARVAMAVLGFARGASLPTRTRVTAVLLGLAMIAIFVDAHVFPRLYPGVHALLLGLSWCTALLAATVAPPLGWPRSAGRSGLASALALIGMPALSLALQAASVDVRFVLRQKSTAARQVMHVVAAITSSLRGASLRGAPARERPRSPAPTALPTAPDAHLVLITIDALRPDHTTPWGAPPTPSGEPLTPTLQGLAARGVRFRAVYAQAPHSAWSISSLLTSEYMRSIVQLGLPPPPTLADLLAARGLHTEAFFPLGLFFNGRADLGSYAQRRFGFAEATTWDLDARALTDEVLARLDDLRRAGEPRTFLWVHYFDAHEPYVHHHELGFGDGAVARYDSEIGFLDRELARLVAGLGQLDRPSVIAITADHGEEFHEHGGFYHGSALYEEQVRVPLIVVAPGLAPRVVDEPVELIDLAPTLLALLGEPVPPGLRGDNLGAALTGESAPSRPVFSEVETRRMVRAGSWKLIEDVRRDTVELYDLASDPRELRNLAATEPARTADLSAELHGWMEGLRHRSGAAEGSGDDPPAIALARLGDKRAVAALGALAIDGARPPRVRAEAARLVGALEGYAARDALRTLLPPSGAPCDPVCAEAALALGELTDRRAVPALVQLLDQPPPAGAAPSDPSVRRRASVMLGRLRDPRGIPGLIEALADPDVDLRRKAIHYLGFVGDARAIPPLEKRLDDARARYLVAVALARIGRRVRDPSVLPALLDQLARERYEDNKSFLGCALGLLDDRAGPRAADAVDALRRAALADPPVKWATESLTRLGAPGRPGSGVWGLDLAPEAATRTGALRGFAACRRAEAESTDDYAGSTTCALVEPEGQARFSVDARPDRAELIVRIAPRIPRTTLTLSLNGCALPARALDPGWQELRVALPAPGSNGAACALRAGENLLAIAVTGDDPTPAGGHEVRAEVDHLLVLAHP